MAKRCTELVKETWVYGYYWTGTPEQLRSVGIEVQEAERPHRNSPRYRTTKLLGLPGAGYGRPHCLGERVRVYATYDQIKEAAEAQGFGSFIDKTLARVEH